MGSNQAAISESPVSLEKDRFSKLINQNLWMLSPRITPADPGTARTWSFVLSQWTGKEEDTRTGIREWELDQCKFCGQNRISVGMIFLKCIVRLLWSIQAYPTEFKHFLKVLMSATTIQMKEKWLLYVIRSLQKRQWNGDGTEGCQGDVG